MNRYPLGTLVNDIQGAAKELSLLADGWIQEIRLGVCGPFSLEDLNESFRVEVSFLNDSHLEAVLVSRTLTYFLQQHKEVQATA